MIYIASYYGHHNIGFISRSVKCLVTLLFFANKTSAWVWFIVSHDTLVPMWRMDYHPHYFFLSLSLWPTTIATMVWTRTMWYCIAVAIYLGINDMRYCVNACFHGFWDYVPIYTIMWWSCALWMIGLCGSNCLQL